MQSTTYAITPQDSQSHPMIAHIVNSMSQTTDCIGSKEWCGHKRMLKRGNPFKVRLRIKLGFADKTTTNSDIQVKLQIKLGYADKTTTHSWRQGARAHLHQVTRWMCSSSRKDECAIVYINCVVQERQHRRGFVAVLVLIQGAVALFAFFLALLSGEGGESSRQV